eukprot:CAMPEP_0183370388 /NCGR_PEP_ID=MMETSP0164_2-20130417/102291_1 /TAXON_ID=221442 /ORGANISM="Coccolithus pelagicus ssp braarudi, Strain PLY182g" /LENGTH=108 /DNA_ID=CAMNT_0025546779 /DNA_START=548 /DNA_END=871 /DNA_ORIENTATION=+
MSLLSGLNVKRRRGLGHHCRRHVEQSSQAWSAIADLCKLQVQMFGRHDPRARSFGDLVRVQNGRQHECPVECTRNGRGLLKGKHLLAVATVGYVSDELHPHDRLSQVW